MKHLLMLFMPFLLVSQGFAGQPAKSGDLGIADMKEAGVQQDEPPVFRGRCGGPLSDTIQKCRVAFINGKLVVSQITKKADEEGNNFDEFRGITSDQVRSISWSEPQFYQNRQRFTNEIIYVSSEGKWTRAGFQFAHGDQVKGFYSELLRWMNKTSQ